MVGVPNVGKSTIFRGLSDRKISISYYPGTAVEVQRGHIRFEGHKAELIDIPGFYNMLFKAENETVARKILIEETPDIIIQVVDAKNLKRSLALTSFLAEFRIPIVFVLNMIDESDQRGVKIKRHRLEEMLGTVVVETVASEGVGIESLHTALARAKAPSFSPRYPSVIHETINALTGFMSDGIHSKRALAIFCISSDQKTSSWGLEKSGIKDNEDALKYIDKARMLFYQPIDLVIAKAYDGRSESLIPGVIYFSHVTSTPLIDRIGELARQPLAGFLILFSILTALYFIVGKFTAGYLVDFLTDDVFRGVITPYIASALSVIPSEFIKEAIMGSYGLYTLGFVPAFGLVLPIIVVFFFTFGFIEDSGYFSRLSILLDRMFKKIGLNGKAVLPIVLGFSCVTMATISTRILDNKKERFIAIFLLSLGIPCSPKLSVILVILAQVSFSAFLLVFGVIFTLMIMSGFVLSRTMQAQTSHFIMDVPPIRIPSVRNILKKTSYRSLMFLKEALPLFFLGAFGLFLSKKFGLLDFIEQVASPVVQGFMGLPPQFTESLILGFIRGEAGMAVLKKLLDEGIMNNRQLVIAMTVTILFIPCVTNFLLIVKEQGSKKALAIIASVTTFAILTGGIMNYVLRLTKATF